jgi:hypothetical protein
MGGFWNYEGKQELRSKVSKRDMVDWDLNIYKDPSEETDFWFIAPYVCEDGSSSEYGSSFMLTMSEAYAIMSKDNYFDEDDVWYGMDGFLRDYWDRLSDRVKFFLETLPKYTEDLDRSVLR